MFFWLVKWIHLNIISLGIFAYLNYLTPVTRRHILDILINGLKRLEYRGYDSAGKCLFGVFLPIIIVVYPKFTCQIFFFFFFFHLK